MQSSARLLVRFAKPGPGSYRFRCTMDRFLHFVLLFAALPFTMQEIVEEGVCHCGVFPVQMPVSIIELALQYNVTCDAVGEDKCQQLCVVLAESARDKAPQTICKKLNAHVENLHVAVYAKVCTTGWKFTGLKNADPICCHDGKPIPCRESTVMIEN